MDIKVYWTDFSKNEHRKIFFYYKEKASIRVAKKMILGIENKTNILKTYPNIGHKEDLLSDRKEEFRYLVFENYKIIYWLYQFNFDLQYN